jgi:hypothetical protein
LVGGTRRGRVVDSEAALGGPTLRICDPSRVGRALVLQLPGVFDRQAKVCDRFAVGLVDFENSVF